MGPIGGGSGRSELRPCVRATEAHGAPDVLPFDLARRRWPITYNLPPGEALPPAARQELAAKLTVAIRAIVGPLVNTVAALRARLRAIVLDAAHEVPRLHAWQSEQVLLGDPTARGAFELLKDNPKPRERMPRHGGSSRNHRSAPGLPSVPTGGIRARRLVTTGNACAGPMSME